MTVFDLAINVETFVEIMFEWLRLNHLQPTPVYHTSFINGKQLPLREVFARQSC